MRFACVWAAPVVVFCAVFAVAAPPFPDLHEKLSPHLRDFAAADLQEDERLAKIARDHSTAGRRAEALAAVRAHHEFCLQVYGRHHWKTMEVAWNRAGMEKVATLDAEADARLREAYRLRGVSAKHYQAGRYAEAEQALRQVLAVQREILGNDHTDTAETMNNMAVLYTSLGRNREAIAMLDQAIASLHRGLGDAHYRTIRAWSNLAAAYNRLGRHEEGLAWHRRALAMKRWVLGSDSELTAMSEAEVGTTLYYMNRHVEAERHLRNALATMRRVVGDGHDYTVDTAHNLALLLDSRGRLAEAESLMRTALEGRVKLSGARHPGTARYLNNLALILKHQGRFREAESMYLEAMEINRVFLGESHPQTAVSYNNVAYNLHDRRRYAEAEPLFRRALEIRRQVWGDEHAQTAQSMTNLAAALHSLGRYAEAEPLARQALEIRRRLLGPDHSETLISQDWLAIVVVHLGRVEEAEALARRSMETRRRTLGEDHPQTALSHLTRFGILREARRLDEADVVAAQGLAHIRRVLGEHQADALILATYLGQRQLLRGDRAAAEKSCREAARGYEAVRVQSAQVGLDRTGFTRHSPLDTLAVCLAHRGAAAEAWQTCETDRSRALLEELAAREARPLSDDDRRRGQSLREQLATLDARLREAVLDAADHAELRRQRRELQSEYVLFESELTRREVFPLERVQRLLSPGTALVAWIDQVAAFTPGEPSGGEHWVGVLRHNGMPVWVRLHGSGSDGEWTAEDVTLAQRLRRALQNPNEDWKPLAGRLFRQRLAPILPHLDGVGQLIVLPSGHLAGVPLGVLSDRVRVSYAPSGTVLARLREKPRREAGGLLALGDPLFAEEGTEPEPPVGGVLLTEVPPESAAGKSGLRAGDVLLRYGTTELKSAADLKPASAGEPVAVQVWRRGQTIEARVPPGSLGVRIAPEPAGQVLRQQHELGRLVARSRGGSRVALPGTRREVESIAPLFPKATLLLGKDASRARLDELAGRGELRSFHVLHLATHGELDPALPLQSALVLTKDGKGIDGVITAADILRSWKLDADLVTLSACETALGEYAGGEGYLGFAQALFAAGSRSLLLSLWPVDDDATALLMTRFYRLWLNPDAADGPRRTRSEALTEAQNWLKSLSRDEVEKQVQGLGTLRGKPRAKPVATSTDARPYAHPYYWSGFVLIGDPG